MEVFVYCWTDKLNNKLYVGSHKGFIDDGYICSSKHMMKEYKKRPTDFIRQIIATGVDREIRLLETKILQSINAAKDPLFYNKHNNNGKYTIVGNKSEEHKIKIGIANKGNKRPDLIEYNKNRIGKNNPRFGKGTTTGKKLCHNIETKEEAFFLKDQIPENWALGTYTDRNKGIKNPMFGRKRKKI